MFAMCRGFGLCDGPQTQTTAAVTNPTNLQDYIDKDLKTCKADRTKYLKSSMERTDNTYNNQLDQLVRSLKGLWRDIANLDAGDYRPVYDFLA